MGKLKEKKYALVAQAAGMAICPFVISTRGTVGIEGLLLTKRLSKLDEAVQHFHDFKPPSSLLYAWLAYEGMVALLLRRRAY